MRNGVCFLLIVGIVLHNINVNEGRKRNFGAGGRKKCHNRQFQRHSQDKYSYSGVVQNGLLGTTNNVTQMFIKAKVFVTNDDGCEFFLKLADVTLSEKIGKKPSVPLTSPDFVRRLTAYGLRFTMEKGMVTAIKPSVSSTEADVLNIQRGILSMLQVRQLGHKRGTKRLDDDVSGTCETEYRSQYIRDQSHVEKIKDLNSCKDHTISHTNIDGIPMSNVISAEEDPLLKSTSACVYKINKSKKGGLKSVICKEHFLVRPFSSELGSGAYVNTRSSLSKMGSAKVKKWKFPYEKSYVSSIKYDSSDQHTNAHKPSFAQKVTQMINDMAVNDFHESKFKSAEKFFELVTSIRHLNSEDITRIIQSVDVTKDSVKSHLFDALAQCGTPDCLGVLFVSLQKYNMMSQLSRLMPFLAFTKEPTPKVIRLLMGFREQQKNPHLVLLISALVYKLCQHRPDECAKTGTTISRLVQDMEHDMLRLLGNDCRTKDKMKQIDIYYALKGIGNIGRPTKAIPLIHDCIQNAEHAHISVAAIQALRRMALTQHDRDKLYDVLTNKNEHLEKRVEIFMMLMKDPTDVDIILARDLSNAEDESGQLRSLINSYLRSAVNNKDPTQKSTTAKFKHVLEKYHLEDFDPSPARYSKAFIYSANLYRIASTASGMSLFHPESFVPRTVNLNLTMHMFGYSLNPFEINARMEGMEMVLPKYFGKDGYFGASYLKKIFQIPNEKLEKNERKRRSTQGNSAYDDIDSKVNMIDHTPQAMISLKVFGNEIQLLSLDDLPFLKGELGNRNIIKDLYELTKGKRKTVKQNLILVEVSHAVPTIIGIPLKVAVNVSAVLTMDVKGKVTTKNILFGPKAATIEGSVKPSISIHASGKLSATCLGIGNIGTSFQANIHAAKELTGKVEYEEGKDVIFDLNAEKEVNDVMNVSYNIFHETTHQRESIDGVRNRAKGYFCTSDLLDTTAILGINTCMEISFPVAYYNLSVPYFPLSGPLNFGIRSYPVDRLLTKYRMVIKKKVDLYTVSISTPGSSYERDYEVKLGSAEEGSWTVGFSYGKERKGIVFSTSYDKETNEMKAAFTSNITQLPIQAEVLFFNETDQETFGRELGGAVKLMVGQYYSNHRVYYQDTYDYLAIGDRFEYMRGKVASLELRVQYEPQMFSFKFDHPPTNTHVLAYGMPNMPLLEGGLNVTHGREFQFFSHGTLDIAKYKMDGYVNIQPIEYRSKVNAYLNREEKTLTVNVDANGVPFTWVGSLKKIEGYNFLGNVFNISNKLVKIENKWSSTLNGAFIMWDKFQAGYNANMKLLEDGYEEIGNINYNGTVTTYHYTTRRTVNRTDTCITGNFMGAQKFGTCIKMYTTPTKTGYLLRILSKEGTWTEPALFLMSTPKDGSFQSDLRIMQYVNIKYQRDDKQLLFVTDIMGFNVIRMAKVEAGIEYKDLTIKYANVFDMSIGHQQDEEGKGIYNLRFKKDAIKLNLRAVLKTSEEKFQYTFGCDVRGHEETFNDTVFNVVLKDKLYSGGDDKLYRSDDGDFTAADLIIDFDTSGDYLSGIEYRPTIGTPFEDVPPFKLNREITDKIYQASFSMKSKLDAEFEEKVTYFIDTSSMTHTLKIPVARFIEMFSKYLYDGGEMLKQGLPVFAVIVGIEERNMKKLSNLLYNGTKEYFMTFECNGEEIRKKFYSGSTKDMINTAFTKILLYPYTPGFFHLIGQINTSGGDPVLTPLVVSLKDTYLKVIRKVMNTSILSVALAYAKDASRSYIPAKYQPLLPINDILENFDKTFKNRDVFATKFINYIQTLINAMHQAYLQKLNDVNVKEDFAIILKYLPGHIKSKFIKIMKKTIFALQSWKYNTELTPLQNIKSLMSELDKANFHHLFILNHENIIIKILFQHVKFPGKIRYTVLEFIKNSNYTQLFTRLTKFVLVRLKVQGNVEDHVINLMDSKSFSEYTEKFAKLTHVSSLEKKPYGLFAQLKTILKDEYGIPVAALDLVDELFSNVDIKSFSLKELPAMLVGNKIPNILKKFIIFLQKNMYDHLIRILKTIMPRITENIDELVKLIDGTGKLNEVLLATYKLIIKTLKHYVKPEYMDMNVIELVSKYMDMLLSDEDVALKLKSMLLDFYDKAVLNLNHSFPPIMKELETLSTKIRIHLFNMDVQMLRKNTSSVLLKLFDGIFKELTNYFDAEFRAGLRDKVAELPRFIMAKLINNETLLKDYEVRLEQLNLLYVMGAAFFDQMLQSGNGTFSIVAITKNIIEHARSLEYNAIDTLIDNLDITKYANLTYDTFMGGMKQFLDDIGTIKHGTKTINEHIQGFILKLKYMMNDAYHPLSGYIEIVKKHQEWLKQRIRSMFKTLQGYIHQVRRKENKLIKFALNVLVPGIDGLFLLEDREQVRNSQSNDECITNFVNFYGATYNILSPHLRKKLSEYRGSVSCDLVKLKNDIRKMKKDENFINNLLGKIETILLKVFDENIKLADLSVKMLKSIMNGTALFDDKYDKTNGLGEIAFDVGERIFNSLNKIDIFEKLIRIVDRSTGGIGYKKLVEKYLLIHLKSLPSLILAPVEIIDQFGNDYILPAYIKMKAKFHNISMLINSGKTFILDRISRFTNPENSEGYLKLLPEALSQKVKKGLEMYQNKIISFIYATEKEIRKGHIQIGVMFEKYRHEIRKQIVVVESTIKDSMTKYLGYALQALEKYELRLNKLLKPLKNKEWEKSNLKEKFAMLSLRTRRMKAKYTNIKRQFVNEVRKKIWKTLSNLIKWLQDKNQNIVSSFLKDLNLDNLNKVITILRKNMKQILLDGISMAKPHIMKFLKLVDGWVCATKMLLGKIFPNFDGNLHLTYNLKYKWFQDLTKELIKKRYDVTMLKEAVSSLNIVGVYRYEKIKDILEESIERALKVYAGSMVESSKLRFQFIRKAVEMYSNYSDQEPDVLLKQVLSKYEMEINRTMLLINKAFIINPPEVIEKQIIRFLGLGYKPKTNMFQPLSRTAYLFEKSLVTFDGKPIFLPRDIFNKFFDCKFMLTRDFLWKRFTIYLHEGYFVVELKDAKVLINRKKNNEVTVISLLQVGFPTITEFPVQLYYTTVKKLPNVVTIKSVFGLVVYCQLDVFSCNVTVPGYYHNKTLGLFGTNNVEYSDDLRMPNGKLALNLIEFANAFELTSKVKCYITSRHDIFGNKYDDRYQRRRVPYCRDIYVRDNPGYMRFQSIMQQWAFKQVCTVEDGCSVSKAYTSSSLKETGSAVRIPDQCGCTNPPKKLDFNSDFSNTKVNLQITLLVKLVREISEARHKIKNILQYIESEFSGLLSIQFTIVGFAGNRVFKEPHIQTAFGKVSYGIHGALKAMDLLQFNGKENNEKLGISALKFAAPLKSKRGMKIFILFENDASYTNLLPQLMDVSETLSLHGVILNVVNNYKMKPNVIAKDSHKTRYHLNLPKGEPFSHSVTFPSTDDYIPFMKQTEGAVFTLKAFTNKGAAWSKALPVTVAEVLRKQIGQDVLRCKECTCDTICKNIPKEECDYSLPSGRGWQ